MCIPNILGIHTQTMEELLAGPHKATINFILSSKYKDTPIAALVQLIDYIADKKLPQDLGDYLLLHRLLQLIQHDKSMVKQAILDNITHYTFKDILDLYTDCGGDRFYTYLEDYAAAHPKEVIQYNNPTIYKIAKESTSQTLKLGWYLQHKECIMPINFNQLVEEQPLDALNMEQLTHMLAAHGTIELLEDLMIAYIGKLAPTPLRLTLDQLIVKQLYATKVDTIYKLAIGGRPWVLDRTLPLAPSRIGRNGMLGNLIQEIEAHFFAYITSSIVDETILYLPAETTYTGPEVEAHCLLEFTIANNKLHIKVVQYCI